LESFLKPFVTGPKRNLTPTKENWDEDGQKAVEKSEGQEELARRLQSENPGLEVVHPHAAGIDVGNSAHYVAVRPDCDPEPVRRFECFTADLQGFSDEDQQVAMKRDESTSSLYSPFVRNFEDG
jgi:hypothetical protein